MVLLPLLDEMFRAEAKSQVYGSIHSLIYSNPLETSIIGNVVSSLQQLTVGKNLLQMVLYMMMDAIYASFLPIQSIVV